MAQKSAPENATPKPTEQIGTETPAAEPAPVSATSAASGGATGLRSMSAKQPSVFRRHPLASGIAATAILVVLVSGLTAWGVGTAVTASLTASSSAEMPMGAPTSSPPASGMPAAGGVPTAQRLAFRATIQSMDSDSWTILTKNGKTVTVMIDSTTHFGTKQMPASAGSFAVGDNVVVVVAGGSTGNPTATRVVTATAPAPTPGATPAPTA